MELNHLMGMYTLERMIQDTSVALQLVSALEGLHFSLFLNGKRVCVIYNEQDIDQQFYGLDTDWFGGVGSNSLYFDELSTRLGFGDFTDDAELYAG